MPSSNDKICPYCGATFKRLSQHLLRNAECKSKHEDSDQEDFIKDTSIEECMRTLMLKYIQIMKMILGDKTGLEIVSVQRKNYQSYEDESLAASISALYYHGESQGATLGFHAFDTFRHCFQEGEILGINCGHAILTVISSKDTNDFLKSTELTQLISLVQSEYIQDRLPKVQKKTIEDKAEEDSTRDILAALEGMEF